MAKITLRIGAAVDDSIKVAFDSIDARAKKSASVLNSMFGGVGGASAKALGGAAKGMDGVGEGAEKAGKKLGRLGEGYKKIGDDAATMGRTSANAFEGMARTAERSFERIQRAQKAAAVANKFSSTVLGATSSVAHTAAGITGSLARGAGVDFDVGSLAGKETSLESTAVHVSNAGVKDGVRVDPSKIAEFSRGVGNATGFTANAAGDALAAFVGKTGELAKGQEYLEGLGKLAKATGTDFTDLANAAASVFNADRTQSAEKLMETMRALAGQGKGGAVELPELAGGAIKLTSSAAKFAGDRQSNIKALGALAQLAVGTGGAAGPAQALTSVSNLGSDVAKNAHRFKEIAGIDVMKGNVVKDPRSLIMDVLSKTKGNESQLETLFGKQSGRAIGGLAAIYRDKGGGVGNKDADKAAMDAAMAEFDRLANATISATEETESFNAAMKSTETQTTLFNNQLQKSAGDVMTALTPLAATAAPAFISAIKGATDFLDKVTGHKALGDDEKGTRSGAEDTMALVDVKTKEGRDISPEEKKALEDARAKVEAQLREREEQAAGGATRLSRKVQGFADEHEGTRSGAAADVAASIITKLGEWSDKITGSTVVANRDKDQELLTKIEGHLSKIAAKGTPVVDNSPDSRTAPKPGPPGGK